MLPPESTQTTFLPLSVHLVVEDSRERSRAGGLNDLLASLEQQQNSGRDFVVRNRNDAVHVLLDVLEGLFARGLYRDAVRNGVNGVGRLALARAEEFAIAGAPSACTPMI